MKRILKFTSLFLFVLCLSSVFISGKVYAESEDEVIIKGVYIDSIHIGGMTVEEAKQTVQVYVDGLKEKKITVNVDNNQESITLGDLDYHVVDNNYVEQVLGVGKDGNLIKRYKELKDVEENNLVFHLEYTLNEEKIKEFVEDKLSAYNVPALNASVLRENGVFKYTDEVIGRKVDVEDTIETIRLAITEGWEQQNLTLQAVVLDDMPEVATEIVKNCNALLATFSTTYATSSADRAGNLDNGAKLINNTVLYPGDVFSAYEKLTPFTVENGYFQAGAYANGKVIDSIGGGACQVTTTLYNAVLLSELEVVERFAHSMTISYVDLSRDAAIAGTWKDLKFKNNTESAVLIEAITSGRTITFNIWGNETRDTVNRKIAFETVVLDQKAPGEDVVTEDPTKPTTYQVTTQSAHIGYTTELYKIVYENGIEVSRTRINKSVYNSSPKYVTVGTMEVEPEEPEVTEDIKESENNGKDKEDKEDKNKTDTSNEKEDEDMDVDNTEDIIEIDNEI